MKSCKCLKDQDTFVDMLTVEKGLVKSYATALTEMSNPELRELIKESFNYASDDQNKVFEVMQRKGWYEVTKAKKQKIEQAKQQFCCQ